MDIFIVLTTVALLIGLIVWLKLHPFLAFLLASLYAGIALGVSPGEDRKSVV